MSSTPPFRRCGSFPVDVYDQCSAEEFCSIIQPRRLPAVLRGLDIGPCAQLWSDVDYVISRTPGNPPVKAHVAAQKAMDFRAKNFEYVSMGLHELLRGASEGNEVLYLRAVDAKDVRNAAAKLEKDFPELAEDFRLPRLFEPDRLFSSVLRVSSPEVRVWTHYDVLDNAYVQVVGSKRAILWPPAEASRLYLEGDKSRVVDVDDLDQSEFPLFGLAKRFEALLLPGDVLFIPSMWFHNMRAEDFGIAVNVFWKNLDSELYDKKDPYGNRDLLPAAKAIRMLDNALKQLQVLPPDLKDFYGRRLISRIEDKCLLK